MPADDGAAEGSAPATADVCGSAGHRRFDAADAHARPERSNA
ncbi:hypothetical protein AB0C76_10610 [Kitasatospora sp. NPDC048722]